MKKLQDILREKFKDENFAEEYNKIDKDDEEGSVHWREVCQDTTNEIGECIEGFRYREDISQEKLSKLTGISLDELKDMENGLKYVNIRNAKKISKALRTGFRVFTDFFEKDVKYHPLCFPQNGWEFKHMTNDIWRASKKARGKFFFHHLKNDYFKLV
jgi:transcriptional regulator with XRE-family HTH domain